MNIITAFVREQERGRVEEVARQLGLTVGASAPAAMPLSKPKTGVWRGSRYSISDSPVTRLEIPYWGFHVEDAAEQILRAATAEDTNDEPATVWVTTSLWFGTSGEAGAARAEHPSLTSVG
jgi:hypothetical protein